jgi:hypothetical protein
VAVYEAGSLSNVAAVQSGGENLSRFMVYFSPDDDQLLDTHCYVRFFFLISFQFISLTFFCRQTYIWLVVPIGALTSIDISLSNASLIYIPVSLYTTVKSSVLIYTYLFRYVTDDSFFFPM